MPVTDEELDRLMKGGGRETEPEPSFRTVTRASEDPRWLPRRIWDDYLNKPLLPERETGAEDWLWNKGYYNTSRAVKGASNLGYAIGDAAFGSPVNLISTAATLGQSTLGQTALKSLPKILPAYRGLQNIDRTANALSALQQTGQAAESLGEGKPYETAGHLALAGLGVAGARGPEAPRPVTRVAQATEQAATPAQRIVKRVRSDEDVANELRQLGIQNPTPELIAQTKRSHERMDVGPGKYQTMAPGIPDAPDIKGMTADQQKWLDEYKEKYGDIDEPDDVDTVLNNIGGMKNTPPEMTTAIDVIKRNPDKFTTQARNLIRGTTTSMEKELETLGEAGKEIANRVRKAATDAPIRFAAYSDPIIDDVNKMKKEDFEKVVDYVEGNLPSAPENIKNLGDRIRTVLTQAQTDVRETGLVPGERPQFFYWPHRYDKVPRQEILDELKAKGVPIEEAVKQVDEIVANKGNRGFGQLSKEYQVPGYRKDKDVLLEYLRDVSRNVERATQFGPNGLMDEKSVLSKLMQSTVDPVRAKELMQKITYGATPSHPGERMIARGARNLSAAGHLSLASISNYGGLVPIAVRSNLNDTMHGIVNSFKKDPNNSFMDRTNAYRDISGMFSEGLGDMNRLYEVYGIKGSQNHINRISGSAGAATAQGLFNALKKDGTNEIAKKQLADLVLDDWKALANQDELTDKQIKRAMVRMTELTQGTNEPHKLPYFWAQSGLLSIPQIFLRTPFQVSKTIADEIKRNPKVAVPKLVATGLIAGKLIGNTKELAKTGAQIATNEVQQKLGITEEDKDFAKEYVKNTGADDTPGDRYAFTRRWLKSASPEAASDESIVKALGDLEQGFTFGLPGDMLQAAVQAAGAKTGSQAEEELAKFFWAWDAGGSMLDTAKNIGRGMMGDTGGWRNAAREATKYVPVAGRGVVREIETRAQKEKREKKRGGPTVTMY